MPFIGPWEIALILVIVLILFGPKKLPELARSIGDALRQYRKAQEGVLEEPAKPQTGKSEKELLIDTAKKLGIKTEGKTMEEISDEIAKVAGTSEKKEAQ